MTFEELKENMDYNGYAYFSDIDFKKKTHNICYIPENATSIGDCYSYWDLYVLCKEWLDDNKTSEFTAVDLVRNLYENIEWTFPGTWLTELNY